MTTESRSYVLDSYALLAYLSGEPGFEQVQLVLAQAEHSRYRAFASIINVGEVLYITERELGLGRARAVLAMLDDLPIRIVPAGRPEVLAAAHVKANHRISYADAFAVVAAQAVGGIVLTGDPEFEGVQDIVTVEWMARKRDGK
ncbi:MAG: type II toxin-antitoxin system VapC family toxin [Anaerolineae bacterium]|nr:type II toxin-antitoxin system VapC family toxin [Anaerolineae bacterium]